MPSSRFIHKLNTGHDTLCCLCPKVRKNVQTGSKILRSSINNTGSLQFFLRLAQIPAFRFGLNLNFAPQHTGVTEADA
jgi:hypothetical protein